MSFFRFGAVSGLILAVSVGGACSSSNVVPPTGGPTVRFVSSNASPSFMDVPFPSDAYLVNGHIGTIPGMDAVVTQNSSMLEHALSVHDGFGRTTFADFYIDDPSEPPNDDGSVAAAKIETATLPQDEASTTGDHSSVYLVQLDQPDIFKARIPCRAAYHVAPLAKTRPVLGVGPARGVVLPGGHKFAAVLTSRILSKSGKSLAPSADFAVFATGDRSAPLAALYGGALDTVNTILAAPLSQDGAKVVGLAVFTTNTMEKELYSLRDQLEDAPAPALHWDATSMQPMGVAKFSAVTTAGFTATLDDWLGVVDPKNKLTSGVDDPDALLPVRAHDKIDAVGTAEFDAVNYLQVRANGYVDPDHANFARDSSGKIIPAPEKPTSKIWVTFFLPTATTMPAAGFPVVIVQHGLSNSRLFALDLANTLCAQGWAVAAIDSVTFGARAPEPQFQVDQHTIWATAPGAKYDGPDGFADPVNGAVNGSGDLFGSLLNIGALRDQWRQGSFDTAQLVKVLRSTPDLSPLKTGATVPKIDPAHVAYVGDSLGGIQGAVAAAIEPNVQAWMLDVTGGGVITELASHSPVFASSIAGGGLNFGFVNDQFADSHLMMTLIGTIFEPSDPLLFASDLVAAPALLKGNPTKARNVLQTEVLFDELVTNEGAEALARAAGFPLAGPNVGSNAELLDLTKPDANPHKVPLTTAAPDTNGAIHDVPVAGTTAVVVQVGPGTHSGDLVQSTGDRTYAAPWALFDQTTVWPKAPQPYTVRCPYLESQAMMTGFFSSAFAGQVPVVKGFKPAVRDLDDDGTPDATDPDPNDPTKK